MATHNVEVTVEISIHALPHCVARFASAERVRSV
jgi:hypothetical protein